MSTILKVQAIMEMIGEQKLHQIGRLVMLANSGFSAFTLPLQLHPDKFEYIGNLEQLISSPSGRNTIE